MRTLIELDYESIEVLKNMAIKSSFLDDMAGKFYPYYQLKDLINNKEFFDRANSYLEELGIYEFEITKHDLLVYGYGDKADEIEILFELTT
jgi:hypothetical protein